MLALVELNFAWYSRVSAITSFLLIFLGAASVSGMVKQHNLRLITIDICYSVKNTFARFGDAFYNFYNFILYHFHIISTISLTLFSPAKKLSVTSIHYFSYLKFTLVLHIM